jgi:hypothetical protein
MLQRVPRIAILGPLGHHAQVQVVRGLRIRRVLRDVCGLGCAGTNPQLPVGRGGARATRAQSGPPASAGGEGAHRLAVTSSAAGTKSRKPSRQLRATPAFLLPFILNNYLSFHQHNGKKTITSLFSST